MRTLLLTSLLCSAISLPSPSSDACGVPELRVFMLSTHRVPSTMQTRTFAVLGESVPDGVTWRALAPGTYDPVRIAAAPALDITRTLTLIGPTGTRVVASTKHVFLEGSHRLQTASRALEVDASGHTFALRGSHPDARWSDLKRTGSDPADRDWVIAQNVTPGDYAGIWVAPIGDSDLEAVSVYPKSGDRITFVRRGTAPVTRLVGSALGVVTVRDLRYLLVQRGDAVRAFEL